MSQITVGSLFSGIGGLELGLERAGMRVVWQVEKDDYCRRVLAKHWPNVERFEDVKDVGAHNLKSVDLICGGFPCQDVSYAGKGAGIRRDTRSGLWYEYARIVRDIRPRFVVVENVAALLTRGLGVVLADLADSGYDADWGVLSAAGVGAPHLRRRVFVVAYPRQLRCEPWWTQQPLQGAWSHSEARCYVADNSGVRRGPRRTGRLNTSDSRESEQSLQNVADTTSGRRETSDTQKRMLLESDSRSPSGNQNQWSVEPNVGRVANGVPSRVDRLRALGNAVVPQVAEYIGRLIVEADREAVA